MKCKNLTERCPREATEASGYCFACAEELACLMVAEGLDPTSAWGTKPTPDPDGDGRRRAENRERMSRRAYATLRAASSIREAIRGLADANREEACHSGIATALCRAAPGLVENAIQTAKQAGDRKLQALAEAELPLVSRDVDALLAANAERRRREAGR